MSSVIHITKRELILAFILGIMILAAVAAVGYYQGYQRNIQQVKLMEREQYIRDNQYGKSLKTVQKDNAEIATREVVICAEYQKLYQAYNELYSSVPDITLDKYIRPGSAKGEVDSCYGELQPSPSP